MKPTEQPCFYDPTLSIPGTEFTKDWTSKLVPLFEKYVPTDLGRILEIGSYEGRTTCYLAEKHLRKQGGALITVDPFNYDDSRRFSGQADHRTDYSHSLWGTNAYAAAYARFRINYERLADWLLNEGGRSFLCRVQTASRYFLASYPFGYPYAPENRMLGFEPFDLVFIDGCHLLAEVTMDLFLTMQVVKPGAIVVVDDYPRGQQDPHDSGWRDPQNWWEANVGKAVDHFTDAFKARIEVLHDDAPAFIFQVTE